MTDAPKPKNCPCCGAEMVLPFHEQYYHHSLMEKSFADCPLRDFTIFRHRSDTDAKIAAWNRRVADEELAKRAAEICGEAIYAAISLGWENMLEDTDCTAEEKRITLEMEDLIEPAHQYVAVSVVQAKAELAKEREQ